MEDGSTLLNPSLTGDLRSGKVAIQNNNVEADERGFACLADGALLDIPTVTPRGG